MKEQSNIFDDKQSKILLGKEVFTYRRLYRIKKITVRALTIREILEVNRGMQDFWMLAIGKPGKWLRRLDEFELRRLTDIVETLNDPDVVLPNSEEEKQAATKEKSDKELRRNLEYLLYVLAKNGHNPKSILEYTFPQLIFWSQVCQHEAETKSADVSAQAMAIRSAVWGDENEFKKFMSFLSNPKEKR